MSSEAFAQHVLQQGKVAIVPGSERWFGKGAEGHVRICFQLLRKSDRRIE
jgi:aspartate/methionine/tyrosine aminotransferase